MKSAVRDFSRVSALLLASILFSSCSGDDATAPAEQLPPPPPLKAVPTFVRYSLTPDGETFRLGEGFRIRLVKQMSDGSRIPVVTTIDALGDPSAMRVDFLTVNFDILALNPITGNAVAVAAGSAIVEARIDNVTVARTELTVSKPNGSISGALVVHDFWVVEFQYPTLQGHWFYAPQMTVSAAPGRTVTVLTLRFTVPGLDESILWSCGGQLGNAMRQLNGETYGDWTFTMDNPGNRASSGMPTATVTFVDDTGATGTATLSGVVIAGALPTTYGGNPGACFHG